MGLVGAKPRANPREDMMLMSSFWKDMIVPVCAKAWGRSSSARWSGRRCQEAVGLGQDITRSFLDLAGEWAERFIISGSRVSLVAGVRL